MTFKHVLVPTDFSEPAHHALQYAIQEATLNCAKVTLLHVLSSHNGTDVYYVTGSPEPVPQGGIDPVSCGGLEALALPEPTVVRRDLDEEALARLRDLIPDTFHGVWEVEIADGPAADAITRVARQRDVDLIVMGTHGRTGLQHVLLGSVAEKVVRLAPCPVLTVKYERTPHSA